MAKTTQKVRNLLKRVDKEKPAKADIQKFERLLSETEIWRYAGDVINSTKAILINNASGKNYLISRSLEEGYAAILTDLGYKRASMLEKLLIEQVAICWLRQGYMEYQYQKLQQQSMTLTKAMYWERKLSQSQRRFLRACESLAKIRKMDVKLQVNIAQKQVNVAK